MTPEWFERVCLSALGHRTSQEQTYDLARLVLQRGVPGDLVECGVYAGASCALMARAIMDVVPEIGWGQEYTLTHLWTGPRVHLFDSFQGVPLAGPHDSELAHKSAGEAACSLEGVKANMRAWGIPDELLVYHPGWFMETVPLVTGNAAGSCTGGPIREIALLRLDGDLYESTRVCMEHLYRLVSKGGYIIVDDYDLSGCRKAVHERVMPAPIAWRKWD